MDFTIANINGLLMRSKLLSPDEVNLIHQRWKGEGKDRVNSMPHYLKWMVANSYLTEYQGALIARGHAEAHDFYLGQYKILDRIGRGRMAGVYKAVHQSGQVVAIKVLPPSRAKDPLLLARFQREARLALQLTHPNVVRSFHLGESANLHYLVMEHLEGETLDDVLRRRRKLPVAESVRLAHQALQGLQHIHEKNFVHRDLKPANLMLVPARASGEPDTTLTATVKILDIGLGRELFDESAQVAAEKLQLTAEGVLLGTPDYLAPEQARDPRGIDVRCDIYSLGCVLYHCLAGQTPFPDSNVLNQMVRHATETARPVREFTPEVPDGLQQVLNYMMAKDPKQRYPTPERAAGALQMFLVAGAPVRPIDEAPQMKRYLTCLEVDAQDAPKTPDRPMKAVPVVDALNPPAAAANQNSTPPAPPPPPAPAGGKEKIQRKHRKHRHHRSGPGAAALPADIDVELVTVPGLPQPTPGAATAPAGPKTPAALTRRDWLLLAVGGGAVVGAVLLGWLLAKLF